jgi:hypothetical protein
MVTDNRTSEKQSVEEKALANLLDAVGGVLAYDYCDCDPDVVEAMERLQKAAEDYGTIQRLSA